MQFLIIEVENENHTLIKQSSCSSSIRELLLKIIKGTCLYNERFKMLKPTDF